MVTEKKNKEEIKEEVQTPPASSPEQQQAKSQIERKAEHLDEVVKTGEQLEKETQGKNPDWKEVKDLHAGKAPIDKVLYEEETPKETSETKVKEDAPKVEVKTETKPESPKKASKEKVDIGPKFRSSAVNEWIRGSESGYNKK